MSGKTIVTALLLVALLGCSAFFSSAETSLTSVPKARARQIKKGKTRREALLSSLLERKQRVITSLLIGNNVVNIWASSLATAFAIGIFGESGVGMATLAMTIAITVFSEITPKTIAAADPIGISARLAPITNIVTAILGPVASLFSAMNERFLSAVRRFTPDAAHRLTEDEIITMVDVGKSEGALDVAEHALLRKAIDFTGVSLRGIMTPRTSIAAVRLDDGVEEILKRFRETGFSRLIAYEGDIDEIRGVIHYKDALFAPGPDALKARNLARPAIFVPETQTITQLLSEMKKTGQHIAVVVDEHGLTSGIVSLDDAIGAVFGGIRDEYDQETVHPRENVQILSRNHLRIPGNLHIDDLNALIKTDLISQNYETVGGFMLEQLGRLPLAGMSFSLNRITFTVLETIARRVARIDVVIDGENLE